MIKTKEDMIQYIRQDMERNSIGWGGGKKLDKDTRKPQALVYSQPEAFRVLLQPKADPLESGHETLVLHHPQTFEL